MDLYTIGIGWTGWLGPALWLYTRRAALEDIVHSRTSLIQ